jgi:hypothetical protein
MTKPPPFDWSRVRWDGAHERVRDDCSYCGAAIGPDEVPLRMWNERGDSCVFCDRCDGAALRSVLEVQKAIDKINAAAGRVRSATWVRPEPTAPLHIRPRKPRLH